jgi:hypothetical protein
MKLQTRIIALTAIFSFTALGAGFAACGGSDDDDSPGEGAVTSADAAGGDGGSGDDASPDDASPGDDAEDDGDDSSLPSFGDGGTAVIVVEGQRYEAILSNRTVAGTEELGFCRDIFDALQIFGYAETDDGEIAELTMLIPPTDWETYDDGRYDPPSAELKITDAEGFIISTLVADPENTSYTGNSQVDSYELDGTTATGTVTFTNETLAIRGGNPEPVQATFEVNCGE